MIHSKNVGDTNNKMIMDMAVGFGDEWFRGHHTSGNLPTPKQTVVMDLSLSKATKHINYIYIRICSLKGNETMIV